VTATDQTRQYGDANPTFSATITGFVNDETEAGLRAASALSGQPTFTTTATTTRPVGTYAITAAQGSLLATNYSFSFIAGTLTIGTRPVTVTADAKTKIYGDSADPALTYQVTSGSLASGDSVSGGLARVAGTNVGAYAINQGTLTLNSNYTVTYVSAILTIAARPVTVTADVRTKVYGTTDPALTYQVTSGSVVAGDTFSGAPTRVAGENVGTYAVQQGALALGSNYNLTFVSTAFTITRAQLSVTANNKTNPYGAAAPVFDVSYSGFVNGEGAGSLTGAVVFLFTGINPTVYSASTVVPANPGTYSITPSGLTSSNYAITFVPGNYTLGYAACNAIVGSGGVILQPINSDGTSVYQRKSGSTVPVKFRVCNAAGQAISTQGAVFAGTGGQLSMQSAVVGTITSVNETAVNDIPDAAFRWDASGQQWIFNMSTSNLNAGTTYTYQINLAYGNIQFRLGMK
jgi:hypothetical protein